MSDYKTKSQQPDFVSPPVANETEAKADRASVLDENIAQLEARLDSEREDEGVREIHVLFNLRKYISHAKYKMHTTTGFGIQP